MKFIERYSFLVHILGWLAFSLAPFSFFPFSFKESIHNYPILLPNIINNLLLMAIFYLNLHWLTPNMLKKGNLGRFYSVLAGALIFVFLVDIIVFQHVFRFAPTYLPNPDRHLPPPPTMGGGQMPPPPQSSPQGNPFPQPQSSIFGMMNTPHISGMMISFVLVVVFSSMMALIKERAANKAIQQQIIYEKLAAELAVLKLQVSPHFLFNTLNNIRWLARQKSDKTEGYILQLSDLLRYMIYHANHERVALQREIMYLKNYIDLQRMRLVNPSIVHFNAEGISDELLIEPMLFIPFVENAFKYGLHSQSEAMIDISLTVREGTLYFFSQNDIFKDNTPSLVEDSGIGIQNVRKRLALNYPNQHQLEISDDGGKFTVNLSIQLQP